MPGEFDIHAARAAGYSDGEIGSYLRSSGRAPAAIANMLSAAWDAVKPTSSEPTAFTRITHTPVTFTAQPQGQGGLYENGAIEVGPQFANGMNSVLPHEQAHAIYDQAGLKSQANELLPGVPPARIATILGSHLYDRDHSAENLTNEGLAYTIGQPWAEDDQYVNAAAARIADPALRAKLLRLHANRRGALAKGFE